MTLAQRLPASLTPLDVALSALLRDLEPLPVVELPLKEALGCVVAELPPLKPRPPHDLAAADGWALHTAGLVGASSYTPVPLKTPATWVEVGDRIPDGCDCVVDADSIEETGPITQVLSEAIPGQGVRRAGGDIADGFIAAGGGRFRPLDILLARAAGLEKMKVRRPRVRLVNVPARNGEGITAELIGESARAAGADTDCTEAASRDVAAIAEALDPSTCDLMVTIGGSGVGRSDATILALAQRGDVIAHGLALRPGRTTAIGRIRNVPVVALSGSADHALAGWWTLALPALDLLSKRRPRQMAVLPLQHKIASSVGIAEIALLGRNGASWVPLAVGDLPFETIVGAQARLTVPGSSEGFAAGTPVAADTLGEW